MALTEPSYEQKLADEAALWGSVAAASDAPPDWRYQSDLRHNIIFHKKNINALLSQIQPGMQVLELGCGSGWLTLAMAQRGADATGVDISAQSLEIARDYYAKIHSEVSGSVIYQVADLNSMTLNSNAYDVIVIKGTLHHLPQAEHLIDQTYQALKQGGLLWVSDENGEAQLATVLVASGLMFVLPTVVSYPEKVKGLLRFGTQAPSRIKASMEAEGLSPFEGAGRDHDWVQLIEQRFSIEKEIRLPAITGYLTHQVKLPNWIALPLLRTICRVDNLLVQLGLLHSTGLILYGRKDNSTA